MIYAYVLDKYGMTKYEYVETEKYYTILPDLPQIPEKFLTTENLNLGGTEHATVILNPFDDVVRPDGKTVSPTITSWFPPDNLLKWLGVHVYNSLLFRKENGRNSVVYRQVAAGPDSNFFPPHTDVFRHFTLLYNINDCGGDNYFWQEKGQPIFRKSSPGIIKDYSTLDELCHFKSPIRQWYLINNRIIHSVENLSAYRESIQIDCAGSDPIIKHLKPYFPKS